ncbi:phosphate transporter PHO1 homolog 7-like [Impatiens glandulifera]|uniref:phosphate transporter PHO1 homolog 7-like n=1 Tax=Impatiens glandulifera TaxID=253017 RepID=UPI001FB19A00|nr:phosphate transporter PHO1 homolog 7-like [Impatiens glandulifera]
MTINDGERKRWSNIKTCKTKSIARERKSIMKFAKELQSQMVPEWRTAYMDYDSLKSILEAIETKRKTTRTPIQRKHTIYRNFSGLTRKLSSRSVLSEMESQIPDKEFRQVDEEVKFVAPVDDLGELEVEFFKKLDDEVNKVVKFYKAKVEDVMNEANMINKQMEAFIAFRIKVHDPPSNFDEGLEMARLASEVANVSHISVSSPSRNSGTSVIDVIKEEESYHEVSSPFEDDKEGVKNEPEIEDIDKSKGQAKGKINVRHAALDILDQVKLNNPPDTPRSTFIRILKGPAQNDLKFNRYSLKKIELQLKEAFVEFHYKLRLLKSFSYLNMLAFSKITKKYDKISTRSLSASYMKMVDNTYLDSSELNKLVERVEDVYSKHFAKSNRKKARNVLRPKARRERHRVTFIMGFLFGCAISLIVALILLLRAYNIWDNEHSPKYMDNVFPLYSLFGYLVLHLIMFAGNIYFWRRYRVNYSFIFGFKEGNEIGYIQVLFVCFAIMALALSTILANLDMERDPVTKDYNVLTELLPLGLLVLLLLVLFCPINIFYRSSRFFFITCLFHCICAPLYKVVLADFFLADQFTSQVQALRSLEFYICYYGWGDFRIRENNCRESKVFNTFLFIVAIIPYWIRFLQCLRRMSEGKKAREGANALKYLSTIVAVSFRTANTLNQSFAWNLAAWITSGIATIFVMYWDIVIDWGLFQKNSKNKWLRDELVIPHKSVYYVASVLNLLLRFAWMQTVLKFELPFMHRQLMLAVIAALEIIRRGIWNFFRLENEHLNNVGNFRAFKSVPLPFQYEDDELKDE